MSHRELINFWQESGREDWRIAKSLFKLRYYPQALFFCHLTLEKTFKGLIVIRTSEHAPYVHDLVRLAEYARLNLSPVHRQQLALITTFNISGRYAEEKRAFARRCTKTFTHRQFEITDQLLVWLHEYYRSDK